MSIFNLIEMAGGLALFLYGMQVMGDGLKAGSSGALKNAIAKVTNSPWKGFILGVLVTGIIQSSTATIVLTSGLVGAGLVSLHQSVGIILGANVGTTVTGQIIRLLDIEGTSVSWLAFFQPDTLAPVAAIIGILLLKIAKKKNTETIGNIAIGFGILFTGLLSMTSAVTPLSQSDAFQNAIMKLSGSPVLGFAVGAAVAFVLQSSSATIGILQAMSMTGSLTFSAVYPIIIGVYLGDCVTTAIVCSIGAKADAKRTGIIHVLFNLSQELIIAVVMTILHRTGAIDQLWNMVMTPGIIANTHTIFKLSCCLLLLPFSTLFENLSRKIVPNDEELGESIEKELEMLNEKLFTSPALALNASAAAISKMLQLGGGNVLNAMEVLRVYDQKEIERVNENEEHIDRLADAVDNYLIHLSPRIKAGHENDLLNYYMQCFGEFERIGDYAVNLCEDAQDLRNRDAEFSDLAKEELAVLKDALNEILDYTYYAFTNMDYEQARMIEPLEEVMDDLVAALRNNHIQRLRDGRCTTYAGLAFLDALVNIERIADQCSNVGVYTLGLIDDQVLMNHHDYLKQIHSGSDSFFNEAYTDGRDKYFSELSKLGEDYSVNV